MGTSFYFLPGQYRRALGVKKPVVGQKLCVFGRKSNGYYYRSTQPTTLRTCASVRKLSTSRGKYSGLVSMSHDVTEGGDSGGPWYSGGYAYGVHSGWHRNAGTGFIKRSQFTPFYSNVANMGLILNY